MLSDKYNLEILLMRIFLFYMQIPSLISIYLKWSILIFLKKISLSLLYWLLLSNKAFPKIFIFSILIPVKFSKFNHPLINNYQSILKKLTSKKSILILEETLFLAKSSSALLKFLKVLNKAINIQPWTSLLLVC